MKLVWSSGAAPSAAFIRDQHAHEDTLPQVPLESTTIKGWREYSVESSTKGVVLYGGYGQAWHSPELHAMCLCDERNPYLFFLPTQQSQVLDVSRKLLRAHLAVPFRKCGVYIVTSVGLALNAASGRSVRAEMSGWGASYEYEHGWRVEYARIDRLYMRKSMFGEDSVVLEQKALQEKYKVPVEVIDGSTWEACETVDGPRTNPARSA